MSLELENIVKKKGSSQEEFKIKIDNRFEFNQKAVSDSEGNIKNNEQSMKKTEQLLEKILTHLDNFTSDSNSFTKGKEPAEPRYYPTSGEAGPAQPKPLNNPQLSRL